MSPIFSSADPEAFDPILARAGQYVDDLELIRRTSTFRHQLQEFNRMAEAQLELFLLPGYQASPGAMRSAEGQLIDELRKRLMKKAKRFGERLLEKAESLRQDLRAAREQVADLN